MPRVEGDRARRVEFFDVFTPMALAGIRGLHATTEDRCLPLVMQRGTDRARVNAEVNPEAPALARIRDGCYRLLLTRSAALAAVPLPAWLNARARELWRPLLALAHVADQEEQALPRSRPCSKDRDAAAASAASIPASPGRVARSTGRTRQPGDVTIRWRRGLRIPPGSRGCISWRPGR